MNKHSLAVMGLAAMALGAGGSPLSDAAMGVIMRGAPKPIEPVTPVPYDGSTRQQRRAMQRMAARQTRSADERSEF